MLTNSLLAGAFGAAYLTIIVLQLNPSVPLLSATPWWWFVTFGALYGVHLAALFYAAIVAREFVAMDGLSPGWVSVRLLAWLGAALSAVAALLMWLNVRGFALTLGPDAAWRMTAGAVATSASALVLLSIAIAHYSFGRRGSRVGAWLFFIAVTASMTLPLAARGPGTAGPGAWGGVARTVDADADAGAKEAPRVTLLLLDGASLEHIWPRAAEGRLPHFGRLLDGGAVLDLATIRPTQPDPVWVSAATGAYPATTGVRSAARYYALGDDRPIDLLPDHCLSHALVQFGFVRDEPFTSAAWGRPPLWRILADEGVSSGIVRWPLTHPAPATEGFIVSDRLHTAAGSIAEFDRSAWPRDVLGTVNAVADEGAGPSDPAAPAFAPDRPEGSAFGRDLLYARVGRALYGTRDPRLFAVRYTGLDTVGHYYHRYTQPGAPRTVPEEERLRLGQIVDRYYGFIDGEIGRALGGMRAGDLLLVVAGFGMEPLNPLRRLAGRVLRDPDVTGTHERAPDGFLLAFGDAVRPGRPQRGSIVDLTPTLLYFFGLPVARDMDGFARADLFTREFTAERPVTFIPSYGRNSESGTQN